MAKEDFCFTYYDGDAARDKAHMNRLERGAYDDLISAQRKRGHLTVDDIKKVLGKDFDECWGAMEWILEKDEDGKFFIEWVDSSINKMRAQSKKQKENVAKRWGNDTNSIPNEYQTPPLEIPLEDENEDGIEDLITKEKKGIFPTMPFPVNCGILPEITAGACVELLKITKGVTITIERIQQLWPVFLSANIDGTKFYPNVEAVRSHFINWVKTQKFEVDATGKAIKNGKPYEPTKDSLPYNQKLDSSKYDVYDKNIKSPNVRA